MVLDAKYYLGTTEVSGFHSAATSKPRIRFEDGSSPTPSLDPDYHQA